MLAHHFDAVLEQADPVLQVTFFMIIACQIILGVSRRGGNFMLALVNYIIQLTVLRDRQSVSAHDQKLLADIPKDVRTLEKNFNLGSPHIIFAVCPNPNCHALYAPTFVDDSPVPIYPTICSYVEFAKGPPCGTSLLRSQTISGAIVHLPIKRFIAFDFKDWFGGLLSRKGFEEIMAKAWGKCRSAEDEGEITDIFEGEELRNFMGPDGKLFSLGGRESRYVFSLGLDFFNPGGNKQAGKKKSIGLISLICLNLPISLQNLPENMFLFGVIPGPNEPPLQCTNHYLGPLVDVMLQFWSPGVRYSRTYEHFYGVVVLAALVCVVCDLLAARKVVGFASPKHTHMCALCHCTRKIVHGLGNTATDSWKPRTKAEFKEAEKRHKAAKDAKERQQIVDSTGIRWSELSRLPYFDPCRHVVVDTMHNLFLGLVREHLDILGIRDDEHDDQVVIDVASSIPPNSFSHLEPAEQKSMKCLINMLERPMTKELQTAEGHNQFKKKINNVHLHSLQLAFSLLNLSFPPPTDKEKKKTKRHKMDYTKAILAWVHSTCYVIMNFL